MTGVAGPEVRGPHVPGADQVLTREALGLVARLHRELDGERRALLEARAERQRRFDAGELPGFLDGTRHIREGDWRIAPVGDALQDRRVEITGPVERKMMINALNSGARVFLADFEDALTPTWANVVQGQRNLAEAYRGTIEHSAPDGRSYRLGEETATMVVRPRGWHLPERHVRVGGEPVAGALFDFGMLMAHNARHASERGVGPFVYVPKLESHLEARLWNDAFVIAQDELGLPRGTVKATVLIETVLAAFEMDEILHELRDHAAGLNAGRWDYIFSVIKRFRERPEFVLPDRAQVTMTVPFMRAYTELLVRTCHRRGAHAIGGMAAFIPSRRDPEASERAIAAVRADKQREAGDGFDGTWVAHPDLVPVAREAFDEVLGARPHQHDVLREDVAAGAGELLDVRVPGGTITGAGLRNDVAVGIRYLASWLGGNGAVALFNLMEDAATAEIARAQIWQWARHGSELEDGRRVDRALVRSVADAELARIRDELGDDAYRAGRFDEARELFEETALAGELAEFLTLPAYERID